MMVAILTLLTLVAFAANSLLCRLALGGELIDPVSFTTLRLTSGALALVPLSRFVGRSKTTSETDPRTRGSWASGFTLFVYAAPFSLAYLSLSAGTGALILFGAVQVTMMGAALRSGETLDARQWIGSLVAVAGLVYLVLPGISAPDPVAALLMSASGVAWGVYSVRGRGVADAVALTAGNFARAAPMAILASVVAISTAHLEPAGVALALTSGVVTSGLGYVLWYRVLRDLTTTQASVVQLTVPVITAIGGTLFLAESVSLRLVGATALILGGVGLAIAKRRPEPQKS